MMYSDPVLVCIMFYCTWVNDAGRFFGHSWCLDMRFRLSQLGVGFPIKQHKYSQKTLLILSMALAVSLVLPEFHQLNHLFQLIICRSIDPVEAEDHSVDQSKDRLAGFLLLDMSLNDTLTYPRILGLHVLSLRHITLNNNAGKGIHVPHHAAI